MLVIRGSIQTRNTFSVYPHNTEKAGTFLIFMTFVF